MGKAAADLGSMAVGMAKAAAAAAAWPAHGQCRLLACCERQARVCLTSLWCCWFPCLS